MIAPRRAEATDDLDLVPGVLGLVALADGVRSVVHELAGEGEIDQDIAADVLDALLGLAELAEAVSGRVPMGPSPETSAARPPKQWTSGDLLR